MKLNSIKQLPEYIRQLQAKGEYWFLRKDIQKQLGISTNAMTIALWRLAKKKAVCRIHGDFYVIVPLEYQAVGCLPPEWFIDALMQHLNLKYYVALLTAASFDGAADQQVMIFQVMTQKRLRSIIVGNQKIVFYYQKTFPETRVLQQKKTPASYFKLSTPELTAIDLVRYMDAAGQVNHVATVLYELAEKINIETLSQSVQSGVAKMPDVQRLGYIFDVIHVGLDLQCLENSIQVQKPNYIRLVSDAQKKVIEHNRHWYVLVNELIEMDEI